MATGAPGTNGVWQYGEDDSEATFSALLNKVASTADTQIGVDRGRLTTLEARKLSGLVPVIPSGVTVSGGTGSYNSTTGLITFATATEVRINGVFTSAYANYRVVINSTGGSANQTLTFRYRASSTDYTANGYAYGGTYINQAGAVAGVGSGAATEAQIGWIEGTTGSARNSVSVDLFNPQTATAGKAYSSTSSSYVMAFIAGFATPATSFDGITLRVAGNFSGTAKVYGYN